MKTFFAICGAIVLLLWGVAYITIPRDVDADKTVIYWSTDKNPARDDQIAPYHDKYPAVVIKIEPNTFEKTIVQCSTGIGPDLIEIYSVSDFVAYVEAGILMDVTEQARAMGFSPESTYPNLADMFTYDGRQYAYPANLASQILFYNKRMFREAGLSEPTDAMDWDEFIALVKPLTVRRENSRGYEQFAMVMGRHYAADIHLQFGGRVFNETGTRCILDSSESIRGVQFYHDLMKRYEVIPTPDAAASLSSEGGWGSGEIRWFATERAACIWGSRWMLTQFRQYPDVREEIGCVLLPKPTGGKPASYTAGRTPAINVNTEHPEESLNFLAYLASSEYSHAIAVGADALPPSREYAKDPTRLYNPAYPWETYQEKFVESMEYGAAREISPFVDPKIVDRIWIETLEMVENGLKSPEEALRNAAGIINDRIAYTIRERPGLRAEYEALARKQEAIDARRIDLNPLSPSE